MPPSLHWRPEKLEEFIGQSLLIKRLIVELKAAKRVPRRPLRHLLLTGAPGMGKTAIADLLAACMGSPKPTLLMGKSLTHEALTQTLADLASPGYSGPPNPGRLLEPEKAVFPIVIIDECEELSTALGELLHHVLEPGPDGRLIFDGKLKVNHREQAGKIWIVQCTFVFLTNYLGTLLQRNRPLVSRIPIQHHFEWYEDGEIKIMVQQYGEKLGLKVDDDAALLLASRAYGVPRHALKTILPVAEDLDPPGRRVTLEVAKEMLDLLTYNENGLSRGMFNYLSALKNNGGRMGLNAIAGVLGHDAEAIEEQIEPALMRLGYVMRCTSGREITAAGEAAMGGMVNNNMLSVRAA